MNFSAKKLFLFFGIGMALFLPVFCSLAAEPSPLPPMEVPLPTILGYSVNQNSSLVEYLRYIFYAGMVVGFVSAVFSLALAGIAYLLGPITFFGVEKIFSGTKEAAKDRLYGTIQGLLILALLYMMITTINPQLAIFRLTPLGAMPSPTPAIPAGVYFHRSLNCSTADGALANTASLSDLGELKNHVNSARIIQPSIGNSYVSILYGNINFSGKCRYINPTVPCQTLPSSFPNSASIYQYDGAHNSGSVTFYRRPRNHIRDPDEFVLDRAGGYLRLTGNQIGRVYGQYLDRLFFAGTNNPTSSDNCSVPGAQQECLRWVNGRCQERRCPNLNQRNINSIKVDGDFLVLLVYSAPDDPWNGPWTYCQEFPHDADDEGPRNIEWVPIENMGSLPNYLIILPIKR